MQLTCYKLHTPYTVSYNTLFAVMLAWPKKVYYTHTQISHLLNVQVQSNSFTSSLKLHC